MKFIDSEIISVNIPQPDPAAGSILVAQPLISDKYFHRSVVYILDHSADGGTMGFVINHESPFTLSELFPAVNSSDSIPVFIGGPVHPERLTYLHTLGSQIPESVQIAPGLFVGGDFNAIKDYLNSGGTAVGTIRFLLGYSGWETTQLRSELDNFDWAVAPSPDANFLLTADGEHAWRQAVTLLGPDYRKWLLFPPKVTFN
jgi:putative transcriptional regulator